jgi:hemerythrin-like domain-containing protein
MKCTNLLAQEHKVILRALDVLDQMAARVAEDHPVDAKDVETLLHFLRTFADDVHQSKEESALFPELRRTSAATEPALRQMLFEHDQERSLVRGLDDSLHTKKGLEFGQLAGRLSDLLRNHIRKEDKILFEIVDRSLSAEQDDRVTTELNQFQIGSDFLADLRRLEWTYLRRTARYA